MGKIIRNIKSATPIKYDLIIIGGGIHGSMLALQACLRNLKPLLIEKGDFGESTSYNSLRIIHGGFRYLQTIDLVRLLESARERSWFLNNFSNLIYPLPCLMPLYGKGLRRPIIMRMALKAYDKIIRLDSSKVPLVKFFPEGKFLNSSETENACGYISANGLKGGAMWHDAFMPDSQRVLIGALKWACEYGATALNYIESLDLIKDKNKVVGLSARDNITGQKYNFMSDKVINVSGPWCRDLSLQYDRDDTNLFRSMIAWNILFDREAISDCGVAISPYKNHGHTYFIVPWKGRLLAGTGHSPWRSSEKKPMPSEKDIIRFCNDLNLALPNINLSQNDISQIYPGLQSATHTGGTNLSKRPVFISHADKGGPAGLFSISGIKFTTSRSVAEKTINLVFPNKRCFDSANDGSDKYIPKDANSLVGLFNYDWLPDSNDNSWKKPLKNIIDDEAVIHLDDLVLRRTSIGDNPNRALKIAPQLCNLFEWDTNQQVEEIARLRNSFYHVSNEVN